MSYMMLYKFNSSQNAQLFYNNASNQGLVPTIVDVPQGWIGPSGPSTGIGQPSSQPSSTYSYVIINNPTQYNPYAGEYKTELIFDNSTRVPLYVSPNIDPNTITIMDGDNTIFYKGLPTPDWTPPPPAPLNAPIEYQPIYYPGQDNLQEIYSKVKFVVPPDSKDLPPDVPMTPDQGQPDPTEPPPDLMEIPIGPPDETVPLPAEPPGLAEGETSGDMNFDPLIDPGIFITPPGPVDPIAKPPDVFKKFNPEIVSPISSQGPSASGTGGLAGVHFDGATGLFVPALSTLGTSKVSFSGFVRSAWKDPNPPLFIVDPGNNVSPYNNNDPQVEAVGGAGGFQNILVSVGNVDPVTGFFSLLKSVVTTGVVANVWQHFIGTADGSTGNAAFLVNGVPLGTTSTVGTGSQPFSTSPTNGKPLYIGLDTLLDFFTGDLAVFGVWMDVSFLSGASIPQSTINLLYNNGVPIIPFGAAVVFGPPTVFLTGPASRALSSPIGGTQQLFYSQGQLTNSSGPVTVGA